MSKAHLPSLSRAGQDNLRSILVKERQAGEVEGRRLPIVFEA